MTCYTYIPRWFTHPSTNRAQCRLTSFIKPTPLTTTLRRHRLGSLLSVDSNVMSLLQTSITKFLPGQEWGVDKLARDVGITLDRASNCIHRNLQGIARFPCDRKAFLSPWKTGSVRGSTVVRCDCVTRQETPMATGKTPKRYPRSPGLTQATGTQKAASSHPRPSAPATASSNPLYLQSDGYPIDGLMYETVPVRQPVCFENKRTIYNEKLLCCMLCA